MKNWIINLVLVLLLSSLCISACSPGQFLGPTVTPTQTATSTATITPTPTTTPSPNATATLEPTKEPYAIDMEKFFNPAPSYEYMVAHPDEYVEAPDLLSDVEAFNDWYYCQYVPALLKGHTREVTYVGGGGTQIRDETNVTTGGMGGPLNNKIFSATDSFMGPVTSELPVAYFMNENVMYVILSFTIECRGLGNVGTYSIILHPKDEFPGDGIEAVKNLYEGKKVVQITLEKAIEAGTSDSEIALKFLNDGFNWKGDINYPYFNYGMGKVKTK